MYLVSYRSGNDWRAGVADAGKLIDAEKAGRYPSSVRAIISNGMVGALLTDAKKALAGADAVTLASVRLGPPIPDPDKIICLGLNYKAHADEAGLKLPPAPILFPKYRNSLIGPQDDIVVPAVAANKVDYEVELAVIIGKRARDVAEKDALSYVAGYACFNDVSARDMQMQTSQWAPGKAIDTFAPMGPGIVPAAEVGDPQNLQLKTRVNGQELQNDNTRLMIFSVAHTIAFITSFMTLEPGDIIATGTPAGVGFTRNPPVRLVDGDVVEVEVEKIGVLRNKVVSPVTASQNGAAVGAAQK
ncbi:MAG TPA: fumarylacetoacetate hydrolase family protein [Candidatus Binatia bacterium]|nr:fumarylacetoacetate hydrolase family protein [Candidatus Binatia bacterium]